MQKGVRRMKIIQTICVSNAFIWMSAFDSETLLPQGIALVSGLIAYAIEKRKNTETDATISVSNDW